jgi:DNA modification methylase
MKMPNIQSPKRESLKHDFESIHLATWRKDDSYNSILVNAKDGETPSSILVYNVVVRKLKYEEKYLKEEMVYIYQKPQALINYLIDTFSNEGDWVLDLLSGSCKNYDLMFMKSYFNLILILIYVFL